MRKMRARHQLASPRLRGQRRIGPGKRAGMGQGWGRGGDHLVRAPARVEYRRLVRVRGAPRIHLGGNHTQGSQMARGGGRAHCRRRQAGRGRGRRSGWLGSITSTSYMRTSAFHDDTSSKLCSGANCPPRAVRNCSEVRHGSPGAGRLRTQRARTHARTHARQQRWPHRTARVRACALCPPRAKLVCARAPGAP